jgi:hypothetical protein
VGSITCEERGWEGGSIITKPMQGKEYIKKFEVVVVYSSP